MKSYFVFQRSEFRVLGMLLAMSIVQSGFGLPVLHPAMYQYMMGTAYQEIQLSDDDVPEFAARQLIVQVKKFLKELKT